MKPATNNIICPNCENEFNSEFKFCPYCGQANKKLNLNFKYLISEFLSANFNLDSKIYLTLKLLITRPGILTSEYLSGKRTKYISPIRLYLLISFVYFFMVSIHPNNDLKFQQQGSYGSKVVNGDSTEIVTELDSAEFQEIIGVNDSSEIASTLGSTFQEKVKIFNTDAGKMMFRNKFSRFFNLGMFVLIPIAALLLFLLFQKGTYYIQHLVFSFHFQSFVFLLFILFDITDWIYHSFIITILKWLTFIVFLFVWLKKYYGLKVPATIGRMIGFIIGYALVFILFFLVVLLISLLNLENVRA